MQNETNVTVDAKSSDHALVSNVFEEMKSLLKELQSWKWFDNIFISIFKRSINNYNEHNFELSQMVFLPRDANFKFQLYFTMYRTKVWEFGWEESLRSLNHSELKRATIRFKSMYRSYRQMQPIIHSINAPNKINHIHINSIFL